MFFIRGGHVNEGRFKGNVALEGYQTDQPRSGVWKGRGELNKGKPFLIIVDLWAYL